MINMAALVANELDTNFNLYISQNNTDMIQMKKICTLYHKVNINDLPNMIELDDIEFSAISPYLNKLQSNHDIKGVDHSKLLVLPEFIKKYYLFIKIIYCCIQLKINIFKIKNSVCVFKNNYDLKKSLVTKKKDLLKDYCIEINTLIKTADKVTFEQLKDLSSKIQLKITILDKIIINIDKLVTMEFLDWTDSLYGLVLPYFYKYQTYAEEYVS
jgi:hypothetical protein